MKLANCFASAGVAVMLGIVPLAWGQATEPAGPGAAAVPPAASAPSVPAEKAAPAAPASGMSAMSMANAAPNAAGSSEADQMSSDYVAKKISEAQAQGKDVTAAKAQQAMGEAALKKGMNNEAAQHFETALRSIGVMPNASGETAGDSTGHQGMNGAVN